MAKKTTAKAKPAPRNKKLFDAGMKVRKQALGGKYVDASMAGADDFMMAFQEITTEYCWARGRATSSRIVASSRCR